MKQYVSCAMLIVRYSLYPVLTVLGLMILGEGASFYFSGGLVYPNLYRALVSASPEWWFFGGFLLVFNFLLRALSDKGGVLNNTILRLGISEKALYWLQAGCNTLVFLALFFVQGLIFLALSLWYGAANPELMNQQTILVTSYQYWMFHTFFPLENPVAWLMLVFLALGLGICTAAYPMRQRHRKNSFSTIFMGVFTLFYLYLQGESSHFDPAVLVYVAIPAVFTVLISLCGTLTMEVDDNG